jgi:hypothetical protein
MCILRGKTFKEEEGPSGRETKKNIPIMELQKIMCLKNVSLKNTLMDIM